MLFLRIAEEDFRKHMVPVACGRQKYELNKVSPLLGKGIILCLGLILLLIVMLSSYVSSRPSTASTVRHFQGHIGLISSVSWSPDGEYLASGSTDTTVRIWEIATSHNVKTLNFRGGIADVSWSPNGKYLATGSNEPGETIKIWDKSDWSLALGINPGAQYLVGQVAWSPDGSSIAVSLVNTKFETDTTDSLVRVFQASSGKNMSTLTHPNTITSIAWSPDGKHLAVATLGVEQDMISLWDWLSESKAYELSTIHAHQDKITSLAWSSDGKYLASGSHDQTVKIWDSETHSNVETLNFSDKSSEINDVAWSPDNKFLAVGTSYAVVNIWDTSAWVQTKPLEAVRDGTSVAWSADSKFIAVGLREGMIKIWSPDQ